MTIGFFLDKDDKSQGVAIYYMYDRKEHKLYIGDFFRRT